MFYMPYADHETNLRTGRPYTHEGVKIFVHASNRRWWQSSREAMESYQRTALPKTCPLFNAMLPHILDDTGELHKRGEPGIEEQAGNTPRLLSVSLAN